MRNKNLNEIYGGIIMKKLLNNVGEFLNKETNISNKSRLIILGGVAGLTAIGTVLNYKYVAEVMDKALLKEEVNRYKIENSFLEATVKVLKGNSTDEPNIFED